MAPSDYFLGFRHFFGYLIPGSLWATGILFMAGVHPGKLTGWFAVGTFVLGSYILGYGVQGPLFGLVASIHERHLRNRDARKTVGASQAGADTPFIQDVAHELLKSRAKQHKESPKLEAYIENISPDELPNFCKRYVLEFSQHLREEINDREGTINFIIGTIPGLAVLGLGIGIYQSFHISPARCEWGVLSIFACTVMASWFFFVRLGNKRQAEAELWLKTFVVLNIGPEK